MEILLFVLLFLSHKFEFSQGGRSSIALPPFSNGPINLKPALPPTYTNTNMSPNSSTIYNVRSYGANGNGMFDDTDAFKSAWDCACHNFAGPAVVLAPKGYTFLINSTIFTGPCQSSITFQVDGTIIAPDGPQSWLNVSNKRQWLVFYRVNDMLLDGKGLIDGKGQKWWNLPCKPHKGINGTTLPGPCNSPVALKIFMSSNITVHGLKIKNSPQFHFRFDNCHNITIDSISINSSALSPNTDGIHIENTNNARIYNSVISTGDDCISIGAGSFNIDINNVTCGPSHGISIGSLGIKNSRACVSNISVSNSIIKNSENGLRIKTWQGGSGSVSAVAFNNIQMDSTKNPIIIDQYYCLYSSCPNQTSNIFISDISYSNIKGTYDARDPPLHLGCSDSVPCTNITLMNVDLIPSSGYFVPDPFCWNVYGQLEGLMVPNVDCLLGELPKLIVDYDSSMCS